VCARRRTGDFEGNGGDQGPGSSRRLNRSFNRLSKPLGPKGTFLEPTAHHEARGRVWGSEVRKLRVETFVVKRKLVGSMTTLCKEMGITVIAEGIEVEEERDTILELGCNLLQGYLLARPGKAFPEVAR
jgi:EAL domain